MESRRLQAVLRHRDRRGARDPVRGSLRPARPVDAREDRRRQRGVGHQGVARRRQAGVRGAGAARARRVGAAGGPGP